MLKIAYADIYDHPLPEGHRFPMQKYSLLPEQLKYEGTATNENFFEPELASIEDVLRVHDKEYVQNLISCQLSKKEERKLGFPLTKPLVSREFKILGGTIQNTQYAIQYGCSLNIAGGTHHAFVDRGEGFCLLNDIAVAAEYLLHNNMAKQILVIDLDVHQGNGTAAIFKNRKEVFTFSMHGEKNYPLQKETSSLDIELEDGTGDAEYLEKLTFYLKDLFSRINPDFVFFQSGVDVLSTDKLGRLGLSIKGCLVRDEKVFDTCRSANVPVAVSMGGGYSKDLKTIVEAHANTYRVAREVFF